MCAQREAPRRGKVFENKRSFKPEILRPLRSEKAGIGFYKLCTIPTNSMGNYRWILALLCSFPVIPLPLLSYLFCSIVEYREHEAQSQLRPNRTKRRKGQNAMVDTDTNAVAVTKISSRKLN